MMNEEILNMVMNPEDQEEKCASNREEIQERLNTDELIKLGEQYLRVLHREASSHTNTS